MNFSNMADKNVSLILQALASAARDISLANHCMRW